MKNALIERAAQLIAHRACCGAEHDPAVGKLHGCCVVCGVPWPCAYAGKPPSDASVPSRPETLHIVFDGPPGHESGRFVEVENAQGRSIRAGEWRQRADGYWELVIQPSKVVAALRKWHEIYSQDVIRMNDTAALDSAIAAKGK